MRRYRRTTLICVGCLALLVGIGLAKTVSFYPSPWFLFGLAATFLVKKRNLTTLSLVIIGGLLIGLWRGSIYEQKLADLHSITGQQIFIEATATSDAAYGNNQQLNFTANKVHLLPSGKSLSGNFLISGFGLNMVYRGDTVRVSGKLYSANGSYQARMSYAQLSLAAGDTSWVNKLTRRLSAGMQNALPEPMASFSLGLLIGQRSNLPKNILNQLTAVGLIHIVAVSGYNVTILARAAARLRLRSKYQQLMLSLALIGLFVLITGFSASIVRAALVSALSLWAWFYGRNIKPYVLIAFSAALTGVINPFYVWGDMSWYLSFLAFFGVLIIAPIIQKRLFTKEPKLVLGVVLETLSAELMTLPLIMLVFGQFSLVALIANVLVVPLIPVAMLLSAIAMCAGTLVPQLAGWLAWPADILLTYMLDIVHLLASIPSALTHPAISPYSMVLLYGLIVMILLSATHAVRSKKTINNTLNMVKLR